MARLETIELENATGKVRDLLTAVQKKMGMVPNLIRTFANSPAVLEAYLGFSNAVSHTALSPKLREQIALAVGEANGCQYCLSAHTALGKMAGLSDEEVRDSRRSASPDRKTEAALKFASRIVAERGFVNDEDIARVREAGFGDIEIAEIVAVVVLNIFTNYFNHVAETELDFPKVEALASVAA